MSQVEEVMEQMENEFEMLEKQLRERDEAPQFLLTYIHDMRTYVYDLHYYEEAARGLESMSEILVDEGIEKNDPLVTLFKEVSTDLYWVNERLSAENK